MNATSFTGESSPDLVLLVRAPTLALQRTDLDRAFASRCAALRPVEGRIVVGNIDDPEADGAATVSEIV